MTIHANINIVFGTDIEYTRKFMEILRPENYSITLNGSGDFLCGLNGARLVILCRTGYGLIEKIRGGSDVPIMYIAEKADEMSVVMALSKGADMVVSENIPHMEFAARVKALLRRGALARSAEIKGYGEMVSSGGVCLDMSSRSVTVDGRAVHMTNLEFGILKYLMENMGSVCTSEDIYSKVWGSKCYQVKKTVVEHIRRIRKKIERDPANPEYLKSIFGLGYTFCGGITGNISENTKTA